MLQTASLFSRLRFLCAVMGAASLAVVPLSGDELRAQTSASAPQIDLASPGLSVAPLYLEVTSRDGIAAATLRIDNTTDDDLPIEISVKRRIFDAEGNESSVEDDDAFVIFPPQLILAARQSQAVRLQYIADEPLTQTEHFYVVVSRVPVDFDEGFKSGLGIRLSVQFAVTVNVTPANADPDIEIRSVGDTLVSYRDEEDTDDTEARVDGTEMQSEVDPVEPVMGLPVTFANAGARSIYLSQSEVRVTAGDGEVFLLRPNDIRRWVGDSIVPAGVQKTYSLPLPSAASGPFAVDVR